MARAHKYELLYLRRCGRAPGGVEVASGDWLPVARRGRVLRGRGLHSSTVQLNVSAFCEIEVALRGSLGGVQQVLGVIRGCSFWVYYV